MDLATGLWVGAALFVLFLVPYLVYEIRRGKSRGHTWFTRVKPRGHSDIGPEEPEALLDERPEQAIRYTKPGIDEASGARR
jgi:hypothetical protein